MQMPKIVSSGVVHPDTEISTELLIQNANLMRFDYQPEAVSKALGITHVRHAAQGTMPSELAAQAGALALKKSGLAPEEIEMVLFCGIDRDMSEPSTASIVAARLGITPKLAFDVSNACAGFSSGLLTAKMFVVAGGYKNALICTGELSSEKIRLITHHFTKGNWGKDKADNLVGAFSLGDAGAAMILSAEGDGVTVLAENSQTKPEYANLCEYGSFGIDDTSDIHASMHMREICDTTISLVSSMASEFYQKIGWRSEDVKFLLQHQVGKRPYLVTTRLFKVRPSISPPIFQRLGNLTSASIPVCYENCVIDKGDKALVSSTGSGIVATQIALVG